MNFEMKPLSAINRRDFVKIGATACAAAGLFSLSGCATQPTTNSEIVSSMSAKPQKQYGMVVNVTKLNKMNNLQEICDACHTAHNVPDVGDTLHEVKWIWGTTFEKAFEDIGSHYVNKEVEEYEFPVLCNHCEQPACVRVCPTKATFKRPDGIVMMDYHRCIGCRFCMTACPYGARSLNFSDPRNFLDTINEQFPTRCKGVVEKCMFCYERIDMGKKPLCVEASKGSILYGDLTDSQSDVRKALANAFSIRRRVELGTGPCVYYIFEEGE